MSWPAPNPFGSSRLPWVPPMALAQPPPLTAVVSHGIQALAEMSRAKNATSQPGRSRRVTIARLADLGLALCDRTGGTPPQVGGVPAPQGSTPTRLRGTRSVAFVDDGHASVTLAASSPARTD